MRAHRLGRGAPDLGVAFGETAVRRWLEQGGQPVAHFRPAPVRQRRDRLQTRFRIAAVERGERQAGLDFRLHAGVGFDANPLAQQRQARLVERAHHFRHRVEPHRRLGARQREAGHRRPEHSSQAVVRAHLGQLVACGGARVLQGQRIDQLERGERVVAGPGDEDLLVGDAVVQAIFEKRGQRLANARMIGAAEAFDDRGLVRKAGLPQLPERGEKLLIRGLRERVACRQGRGEQQQHEQPPPAHA